MTDNQTNSADIRVPTGNDNGTDDNSSFSGNAGSQNGTTFRRPTTTKFKGNIEGLPTLDKKQERKGDSFLVCQKEFHQNIVATYKYPTDIAYLMKDIQNSMPELIKNMPTLAKIKGE